MAHGGKRAGAGRKRALKCSERISIGAECEARCRQELRSEGLRRYEATAEAREKGRLRDRIKEIADRHVTRKHSLEQPAAGIATVSGQIDKVGRLISLPPLKNLKRTVVLRIIREVAAAQRSSTANRRISVATVRRCWNEYRAFLRAQHADDPLFTAFDLLPKPAQKWKPPKPKGAFSWHTKSEAALYIGEPPEPPSDDLPSDNFGRDIARAERGQRNQRRRKGKT